MPCQFRAYKNLSTTPQPVTLLYFQSQLVDSYQLERVATFSLIILTGINLFSRRNKDLNKIYLKKAKTIYIFFKNNIVREIKFDVTWVVRQTANGKNETFVVCL